MTWGSEVEVERRKRIRAALAAYAYEVKSHSIMTDAEYDALCLSINPEIETGHEVLDFFFEMEFEPDTGLWVHNHPEFDKLEKLYERLYENGTTMD